MMLAWPEISTPIAAEKMTTSVTALSLPARRMAVPEKEDSKGSAPLVIC